MVNIRGFRIGAVGQVARPVRVATVLDGTMSFLVGDEWVDAPEGTFIRIPAGVTHDFANRTDAPAMAFNLFIPGGFEASFREWSTPTHAPGRTSPDS